jgi:hypothetical protein
MGLERLLHGILLTIPSYLPNASIAIEHGINAALAIVCFAATRQRSALGLQMEQALLVLAIDHARAPGGPAAYREGGGQQMKKMARVLVGSMYKGHTVEQAKAPITLPIRTNRAVSDVPVAAYYLHRDRALQTRHGIRHWQINIIPVH